jgi:hypothetical protein
MIIYIAAPKSPSLRKNTQGWRRTNVTGGKEEWEGEAGPEELNPRVSRTVDSAEQRRIYANHAGRDTKRICACGKPRRVKWNCNAERARINTCVEAAGDEGRKKDTCIRTCGESGTKKKRTYMRMR